MLSHDVVFDEPQSSWEVHLPSLGIEHSGGEVDVTVVEVDGKPVRDPLALRPVPAIYKYPESVEVRFIGSAHTGKVQLTIRPKEN